MMTLEQLDVRLEALVSDYLDGISEAPPKRVQKQFSNLVATLISAAVNVAAASIDERRVEQWLTHTTMAMRLHLMKKLRRRPAPPEAH